MLIFTALMCMTYVSLDLPNQKIMCQNASQIERSAAENGLDPYTLVALVYVESGWTPSAVSSAGACGLTQVLPKYSAGYRNRFGRKLTCKDLKNPKTSIKRGAKILAWWVKYHDGNLDRALCSYNAGFRCKTTKKRKAPHPAGMRYSRKVRKWSKMLNQKSRILDRDTEVKKRAR